ncbi:ISKra4 family transposase [Candidatus Poribacteria bacterium]|nr:ISKra4 family transposase [Candidatus Poribacteria bacterium]
MLEILTLIREIINQILSLFIQFPKEEAADFDSMETQVRSVVLEIGRLTLETILRVRGTGYCGKRIRTPSGERGKYVEIRTRTMKTLMGPVQIKRAYYHLGKGKGGYVPLDESLSLPEGQYSYAVQEQMSLYAIEDGFDESARKLVYSFPVEASGSTVGRITQNHGKDIYQEEMAKVEEIFSHKRPVPQPQISWVARGYVGSDGVMVPTLDGYREMKVITTYDTSFSMDTVADNLYYHALFAVPQVLGEHLWVLLKKRGICNASQSIWVCDVSKWIWKQKQLHDPDGIEIVDYIHACEYLEKVANAIHVEDTDKFRKCYGCMKILLRKGGGQPVLSGLAELSQSHGMSAKELTDAITYFQNNSNRMNYPKYEALSYHITSSTVESACRHVVGDRLKRSGMRWTTQGAQYITLLRLKWKNEAGKDYWGRYRPGLAA